MSVNQLAVLMSNDSPVNTENRPPRKRKPVFVYWQLQRQAIIEIGKIIRLKRKSLGLTQEELAEKANLSQSKLSNLESGKVYKEIKLFLLIDIAKIVQAEEEVIWFVTKLLEIERPSTSQRFENYFWEKKKTTKQNNQENKSDN